MLTLITYLALGALPFALLFARRDTGPISYLMFKAKTYDTRQGESLVLCLKGEMDHNTLPTLQEELNKAKNGSASRIILDLSGVQFMNSASVSALLDFHCALQEKNGCCIIAAPSDNVRLVLDTLGFSNAVLTIAETVEEAVG